jgi:hypothetical protein
MPSVRGIEVVKFAGGIHPRSEQPLAAIGEASAQRTSADLVRGKGAGKPGVRLLQLRLDGM